jgi:hypothetical protein
MHFFKCFSADAQSEGRLTLEMSLRLQVQRKLEAERLRAMERLRQAEAGKSFDNLFVLAIKYMYYLDSIQ